MLSLLCRLLYLCSGKEVRGKGGWVNSMLSVFECLPCQTTPSYQQQLFTGGVADHATRAGYAFFGLFPAATSLASHHVCEKRR